VRGRLGALLAAAALAAVVGCGSSAAKTVTSRAAALARCAPAGARIIRADSRAQVYALRNAVYGCDARTGRSTRLGNTTVCIAAARVDRTALAGNIVAYGVDRCGVDAGFTSVVVRRLSDGQRLASYGAVNGPGLVESFQSIGSIVVKSDASVAWIGAEHSIIGRGSQIEVDRAQRGRRVLLDSGSGIVGSSLRLRGSTLTWRHASATRTATLG
jgi:hypothetical protein